MHFDQTEHGEGQKQRDIEALPFIGSVCKRWALMQLGRQQLTRRHECSACACMFIVLLTSTSMPPSILHTVVHSTLPLGGYTLIRLGPSTATQSVGAPSFPLFAVLHYLVVLVSLQIGHWALPISNRSFIWAWYARPKVRCHNILHNNA